jgi:hypothetical protein
MSKFSISPQPLQYSLYIDLLRRHNNSIATGMAPAIASAPRGSFWDAARVFVDKASELQEVKGRTDDRTFVIRLIRRRCQSTIR